MVNRTKIFIVFLVLVIVVLGGIMAFSFLIKPKLTGYVTSKQFEGALSYNNALLTQLQQQNFVQVPIDTEGHYVLLVPAQQQPGLPPQPAAQGTVPDVAPSEPTA